MSKRKCFCADCDGKLRSWNTVKRHRTLYATVPFGLSDQVRFKGETTGSSDEDFKETFVKKDHEVSVEKCSTVNGESFDSSTDEISGNVIVKGDGCSQKQHSDTSTDEDFLGDVALKERVEISEESDVSSADNDCDCSESYANIKDHRDEHEELKANQEAVEHEHQESSETGKEAETDEETHNYLTISRWICHILIKLKLNYNCSNTLFSLIITIINFILALIKHPLHLFFPKTLNDLMLISNLKVFNECEVLAVCPNVKCNCIYKLSDIVKTGNNGEKIAAACKNKLFGKPCRAELAYSENLSFGRKKWVPFKKFPFLPPSKWINLFFRNKEFVSLIQQRPEPSTDGSLCDMWDGRVLRMYFKDPRDPNKQLLEDKNNLALLLYLDFFNPFTRAIHSSGVLCMTVLNLPRRVRYQKKWAMLIGIIPGPEEAQRHVNSFLKPVVDDLLLLYDQGIKLSGVKNEESLTRAVLLPVLGDIPASRKISQFLSYKANKPCDKCHMTAKREPGTVGASGRMSFLTDSMPKRRNDHEVRVSMERYKKASSKHAADAIAKVSGVRYSELSRLPYFNTVDNFLVDPMHNLFLGLVEDIGNAIIVQDEKFMNANARESFQQRMNAMRLPYDVGRLPRTMLNKMSGRGITAQQWKNFIITFARVCLWKEVNEDAYRMVCRLAEACEIVLRDPLSQNDLNHLEKLLTDHHKLYAKIFGKFSISINYHMVLHLPEQIMNWGPPTAWWCFPYERRIGELSDTLTSGKSVEEQIFNHFFLQHCAAHLPMPVLPDTLSEQIPAPITPLLETSTDSMTESHYVTNLRRAAEDFFTGKVSSTYTSNIIPGDPFQLVEKEEFSPSTWPVVLLPPQRLDRRVQSCFLKDLKTYFRKIYSDQFLLVEPRIDIFARCNVNGTTFSSQINRTDRGSTVLCYCVDRDHQGVETASPYFAKVSFFFTARVHYSDSGTAKRKAHTLAFVEWYRFANRQHRLDKSSGLPALSGLLYKGDNILNTRRLICRVILAKVKNNYYLVANLSK